MKNSQQNTKHNLLPRVSQLAYVIAAQITLFGSASFSTQAREFFNPALLEMVNPRHENTDLSMFEDNTSQAPGLYRVDIYINNELQNTRDIEFHLQKDTSGKETLQPCLSVAELSEMGVKTDLFPALQEAKASCANLSAIPQASAEFRFSTQQLLLSVPQAAMSQQARDYVPANQRDHGISALLLNYSLSGANSQAREGGNNSNSKFANLRPGINLGTWRLRNYTTWNRDSNGQDQWNNVYTYAARDIAVLKSQLVVGDSTSPSDVFDSQPFRGAQLASDDDMLPDSLKGYAPVVRGIARTNAQVTIHQNGYIIYQTFVAPGAFEINDMFPTGGSGDLLVTIKEADGSEQRLVVPFASLPVLQREGRLKYALTAGQYRTYDSSVDSALFGQGTAIYGLPQGLTLYGGTQFAKPYQSLAMGMGKNLGSLGAFSADVTQARSSMKDEEKQNGQSWRVRYSKNFVETGTNFAIAGYRYSTAGYFGLQEVLDTYRADQSNYRLIDRRRNRSELTMNQNLWDAAGYLSLSWASEDYWNSNRTMRSLGASYNNSWNGISYGLNYIYNENSSGGVGRIYERDHMFAFNVSVPLGNWLPNTIANYGLSSSKNNGTTHNAGLSGTALADNNLSWSIQQGYGDRGVGHSGNLNTNYRGTYTEVNAGYAYDNNSSRLNYGLQGGIVAHQDGVTFGQTLGETLVLVKAPGAAGVGVNNNSGVRTDWRGYAIVPYSSPYRKNQVTLNTEMLPDDVDLELASQNVVPTRGAVVRASFEANVGRRALITLIRQNGEKVPFGATVNDTNRQFTRGFIVGDNGEVYLTGLNEQGELTVKWGSNAGQTCQAKYSFDKQERTNIGIEIATAQCQ
ncbi:MULTISPECIES: fimbria/pilus outer membrane usher protein [unclassified Serratia (in: enterobacteria)]|uniref:fimbria/pilus outer membrane usher protein n=1 Tax=unclassified Serratia (in: enterobacteria) TaxID=2647522 RepID=UPI0004682977|nr:MULTISPECIES: fimbria/pilus outer membrane usher protein [unclassified Serratia (in: enterobacteria)]